MLTKMNNEVKVRRSTRSIVLGKAKVMSFEDIEAARAKRAARGNGRRGRKRKSATLDADEPELEQDVARTIEEPEQEGAQTIDVPEPWRAPVARMI
jgi:hypothetical protein